MNAFLYGKQIDLVSFGETKLFMFKHDNLYDIAVASERKAQSLEAYQRKIQQDGYPPAPVTEQTVDAVAESRLGIHVFLVHLWRHGIEFDIFDLGSNIGDFSIQMGNLVRTFGKTTRVFSFDPTEAGALVDYNIRLNGLEGIVKHENLAIAESNGLVLFACRTGHSDAADASTLQDESLPKPSFLRKLINFSRQPRDQKKVTVARYILRSLGTANYSDSHSIIAESVDIVDYIQKNHLQKNLFVKIDIEGFESRVTYRLLSLLPERQISIICEFLPARFNTQTAAFEFIKKLSDHFYLFDLFYSPNPTRFRLLDSSHLERFVTEVASRKYSYTDLFLMDKRTPNAAEICRRLASLKEDRDSYEL